jgi:hypothetical protein
MPDATRGQLLDEVQDQLARALLDIVAGAKSGMTRRYDDVIDAAGLLSELLPPEHEALDDALRVLVRITQEGAAGQAPSTPSTAVKAAGVAHSIILKRRSHFRG